MVTNHPNDIILWPCGTWCYREELHEFTHKSDDYEQIPAGSLRARDIVVDPHTDGVVPIPMTADEWAFSVYGNSHGNESVPTEFRRDETTPR